MAGVVAAQRTEAQVPFVSGSNQLSVGAISLGYGQIRSLTESVWNGDVSQVSASASMTSATSVFSLASNARQQVLMIGDQANNGFTSVRVINTSDVFAETALPEAGAYQYAYARTSFSIAFRTSRSRVADLSFTGFTSAVGGLAKYDLTLWYAPSNSSNSTILLSVSNSQSVPTPDSLYRQLNLQSGSYFLSINASAEARRPTELGSARSNLNFDLQFHFPGPGTLPLVFGPMLLMARRRR